MSSSTTNETSRQRRSASFEITSPAALDDECDSDSLPVLSGTTNGHSQSIGKPNNRRAIANVGLNDWLNKRTFVDDSVKRRASAIFLSREALAMNPVRVEGG